MLRATSNLLPRNMLRWCKRGVSLLEEQRVAFIVFRLVVVMTSVCELKKPP